MGDDTEESAWPPAAFARQMQEAGEQAAQQQSRLVNQMLSGGSGSPGFEAMSLSTATFKARVQSGGRVSIPDAEREALDIEEGDLVQTIVIPVKKNDE